LAASQQQRRRPQPQHRASGRQPVEAGSGMAAACRQQSSGGGRRPRVAILCAAASNQQPPSPAPPHRMATLRFLMRAPTLLLLLGTSTAQTTHKGYTYVDDAKVSATAAIGADLSTVDASLSNFTRALEIVGSSGLDTVAQTYPSNPERAKFVAYNRTGHIAHAAKTAAATYAENFVRMALEDNFNGVNMVTLPDVAAALSTQRGGPSGIANKSRQELTMKGLALQSVLMASINHLYEGHRVCGNASSAEPAVTFIDRAWSLFAAEKGPIALGEKRCPQFGTCRSPARPAGYSAVNDKILTGFKAAQAAATSNDCAALQTQIETIIVPQMFVPIIQGLVREAWEVDATMSHVHQGADGFVEVVEGWAFASAVLPRIAYCSLPSGETIARNMKIRTAAGDAKMVADGYETVVTAVEATYACMGITCAGECGLPSCVGRAACQARPSVSPPAAASHEYWLP
jgi:hypothetical protein